MAKKLKPANIKINSPTPQTLRSVRKVSSLNTFEGATESFDPNGMYSVETFGRVGEKSRMVTFGYIDAKLEVLHPHVYREVCNLKSLYGEIIKGSAFAKWNAKLKDFEPATASDGSTGYSFFMSHWAEIKFPRTKSHARDSIIKMVTDNKEPAKIRYILVLPAGLREYEIKDGRPSEDVINNHYRRILAISQTVNENVKPSDPINDTTRYQLQLAFNEVYAELFGRMDGKNGFIQSKFSARGAQNSTANVITAMDCAAGDLFGPTNPDSRSFVLGLFQFVHCILPRFCYDIRTKFLVGKTWGMETTTLIGAKSLKPVQVTLEDKNRDQFSTNEGLQHLANGFESIKFRRKPATIEGGYLKLIVDMGKEFYLMDSIEELRDESHKEFVRPLTWGEVFYYSVYDISKRTPVESSRYPVAEEGSAVMTYVWLKTTQPSVIKQELLPNGERKLYNEWPIDSDSWLESSQPHPGRHKAYKADHDGDTLTSIASVAEEVIKENEDYYDSWDSIIGSNGQPAITFDMDITEWTLIGATNKNVGV